MVKVLIGNLFESDAQTLVNTVNTVGIMGKGVALEFKKRFPDMYEDYVARCKQGQVKLGQPYLYKRLMPPWIVNFPTKEHWRSLARLSDIVRGLEYVEGYYREWGITSLAVPPLGCGEGQLEWRIVGPTLYRHLSRLSIPVELYAPYGTPEEELEISFLATPATPAVPDAVRRPVRVQPGSVALVEILARIEREPYHWPVGRTSFQKIAYFATQLGLPTGLRYERGSYGPFTRELKGLMTRLLNNGLIQEQPLGRMFAIKPGPTYEDAHRAYQQDLSRWQLAMEKIADLFLRMRTQDAEVAATVHFATKSLVESLPRKPSESEVLAEVRRWKQRRRPPIDDAQVARTIRNLAVLGWLDVTASADLPVQEEVELGV